MTGWYLAAAVVLLLANAFFVAVEFALVTSRPERLEREAASGRRSAQVALASMHDLSLHLAGAQLGVTMASLGLGFVGEPAIGHLFESLFTALSVPEGARGALSFAVALAVVTFLHLVIGEMVPKNLAIAGPERVMLVLALPDLVYVTCFRPVIRALNGLANLGVRAFGVEPKGELAAAHTAEELARMVTRSREGGLLDPFEHDLLAGALGFPERDASSVMVPRDRVVTVSRGATVAEVEGVAAASGHSRIPVVGRDIDDVLGFVHVKDLLGMGVDAGDRPLPLERLRRMVVVSPSTGLEELLVRMQQARLHLGLVQSASGRTLGLATLEDVLEALVGDIRDESDAGPGRPPPAG